jgi:hypothetical protein
MLKDDETEHYMHPHLNCEKLEGPLKILPSWNGQLITPWQNRGEALSIVTGIIMPIERFGTYL